MESYADHVEDVIRDRVLRGLPGYPFLPCPICHGVEGCDHSVPERARATHPSFFQPIGQQAN